MKSSSAGFSLLEMTIVLAIMGVLGGFAFPLLTHHMERARHQKTREHQREVMEAIETYFAHNQALPWPADPHGKGFSSSCHDRSKAQGIVPYRELGLPQAVAKDGFGYYMTYAVQSFKGDRGASRNTTDTSRTGIIICDESGEKVLKKNAKDSIAYVLISHGPEGTGAYSGKGETERMNVDQGSDDEKTNSNNTFKFITRPYSTNPANSFRHKLVWRTHNRLEVYRDFNPYEAAEDKKESGNKNTELGNKEREQKISRNLPKQERKNLKTNRKPNPSNYDPIGTEGVYPKE